VRNGGKFQLAGFMISIGRSANNQVVLKDDAVSRAHALITCEDDKYFISDLGSTNGTLLNGSPLRSRQRLTDGDVIRLGNTILWFAVQQNCALSIEHAYISL
jgi:pSer/pThr/pTyr-binding forkhead associated (FHA) protein